MYRADLNSDSVTPITNTSAQTRCDITSFHEVEARELRSSKVPQVPRVKDRPGLYKLKYSPEEDKNLLAWA